MRSRYGNWASRMSPSRTRNGPMRPIVFITWGLASASMVLAIGLIILGTVWHMMMMMHLKRKEEKGKNYFEAKAFSQSLDNFKTAIIVGGTKRSKLRTGVNIVVVTPGRFIDYLQLVNFSLPRASFILLDEADRMLDVAFEPQIIEVMRNLPQNHQTLLFSATMPWRLKHLHRCM